MSCNATPPDDRPIGSPPVGADCSPCGDVSCETLAAMVAALRDELCTLKTRQTNWHALLQKARNRITEVERKVANIDDDPGTIEMSLCGLEEADELQLIAGCQDGATVGLVADPETPETIVGCSGKWVKRPAPYRRYYLEEAEELHSRQGSYGHTINHEIQLPDFDDFKEAHACDGSKIRAVLVIALGAYYGGSGSSAGVSVEFENGVSFGVHIASWPVTDRSTTGDISIAVTDGGKLKFQETAFTSGGGESYIKVWLVGYDVQ